MPSLADRWPLQVLPEVRDALLAAYGGGARGHHDTRHLAEVLDALDVLAEHEEFDALTVRLAAWFHDAVYEGERDDEERSALWAHEALASDPATAPLAAEVARLVRVTADHTPAEDDADAAALSDADLSILAAEPERYAAYVAGVRHEYAHLDDATFAEGRVSVLEHLRAGALFHTATGRARWEDAARANLGAELARLGAS